jgi:hypothetical protein
VAAGLLVEVKRKAESHFCKEGAIDDKRAIRYGNPPKCFSSCNNKKKETKKMSNLKIMVTKLEKWT